ncbi:MAG: endolytic transglycosylase MltG [Nitriliruptoraceae bacterium]
MALSRGSRWFLVVSLAFVAAGAGAVWWLDGNWFQSDVEPGIPVTYEVIQGQTVRSVSEDLADLDVVTSSVRFLLAAQEAGLETSLQPGVYDLETRMRNEDVIAILTQGPPPPETAWFTVQEGLNVELTLERLAAQFPYEVEDFRAVLDERTAAGANGEGVLRLPDFVPEPAQVSERYEPYEGVLFPETYEVLADASPLRILQRMVDQLGLVMGSIPADAREAMVERELDEFDMMIIASLIERETRVDAERTIVSGVIVNRLGNGMRLELDATVLYALGEHRDTVLLEDLEVDSPFNTYRNDGLPPTPISGFGASSLRAAFSPDEVTYRFYVLDVACDGTHVFADTLDEHNANVAAFRAAGRCQ